MKAGSTFGHYQIRKLLGHGGMGEVYEAYDTAKDRVVALKILADQRCGDETFRERFRRESHAAAKLQEPHVIPIHDWGDVDGTLYIDMRRVDGVDLRTMLQNRPLEPGRAVAITGQIAAALDAAHAAGLIHRDVKPENIIVTPADFAYLVDFGIAEAEGETRLTKTGTAIGSWAYMAPERFGTDDITPAADIYSLACVLYEMLAGSAPYPATSLQQVVAAHVSAPPPRPSAVNPAVSPSFDEVIARGMAKEPDERYGTGGALGRAAQRALRAVDFGRTQAAPTAAAPSVYTSAAPRPPSALQRQVEPIPQRRDWVLPTVAAAAGAVVLTALGITVLIVTHSDSVTPGGVTNPPASTVAAGVPTPPPARQPAKPTRNPASLPTPVIAPPTPAATLPPDARPCPTHFPASGDYTKSAAGTSVTSCEFAESVRVAYGRSGPPSPVPRVVNAYSPVTGGWYPMTCAANGVLATCRGGDDAVVYAY